MDQIPTSTRLTLDAAGDTGRSAIDSVFLMYCEKTRSKGTGFLLKGGPVVTNEHVVAGCDCGDIVALTAYGRAIKFLRMVLDQPRDLALLFPEQDFAGGLTLSDDSNIPVGTAVMTWGHPLGYNGPNPILSVGYLAGYNQRENARIQVKHLVVNGAFNPGNSGGPLFTANSDAVIGVVVSKHAPLSKLHHMFLEALSKNDHTGIGYTWTKPDGTTQMLMESQVVADILMHYRELTQVMIGEAIAVEELSKCLAERL